MKQSSLSRPLGRADTEPHPFHFHSSICSMTWQHTAHEEQPYTLADKKRQQQKGGERQLIDESSENQKHSSKSLDHQSLQSFTIPRKDSHGRRVTKKSATPASWRRWAPHFDNGCGDAVVASPLILSMMTSRWVSSSLNENPDKGAPLRDLWGLNEWASDQDARMSKDQIEGSGITTFC